MDEPLSTGEILARAAAYPYEAPLGSFVQRDGQAHRLAAEDLDLAGRRPLLAYGANAAPEVLARKLAAHPHQPLPVLRAELAGFDVVYSAHISPYGAVPATLQRSPGTTVPALRRLPDDRAGGAARPRPSRTTSCTASTTSTSDTEIAGRSTSVDAYVSRHGCLILDGSEVALAAIEAGGRALPGAGEAEVLERVRHVLAPELDLERFVASSLDPGLAAARTAVLHGCRPSAMSPLAAEALSSDRGEAAQREAGDRGVGDDQDRQVEQRPADARPRRVQRRGHRLQRRLEGEEGGDDLDHVEDPGRRPRRRGPARGRRSAGSP